MFYIYFCHQKTSLYNISNYHFFRNCPFKLNIHLLLDRNGEPYDLPLAMPRPILLLLHGECCLTPQKLSPGFPCDSSLFLYQFLVNFKRKSISSSRSNIFEWRVTHNSMPFIENQGLNLKKTQVCCQSVCFSL